MSEPSEGAPGSAGRATQTLAQLRYRLGSNVPVGIVPETVECLGMSKEMWLRSSRANGEKTEYQLEREFQGGEP